MGILPNSNPTVRTKLTWKDRARNVALNLAGLLLVGAGAAGGAGLARYSRESYLATRFGFLYNLLLIGLGASIGHSLARLLNNWAVQKGSDKITYVQGGTAITHEAAQLTLQTAEVKQATLKTLQDKLAFHIEFKNAVAPMLVQLDVDPNEIAEIQSLVAKMGGGDAFGTNLPDDIIITDNGIEVRRPDGTRVRRSFNDLRKGAEVVSEVAAQQNIHPITSNPQPVTQAQVMDDVDIVQAGTGQYSWNVTFKGEQLANKFSERAVAQKIANRIRLMVRNGQTDVETLKAEADEAREMEMAS